MKRIKRRVEKRGTLEKTTKRLWEAYGWYKDAPLKIAEKGTTYLARKGDQHLQHLKRSKAAKKAWETRRRRYGSSGMRNRYKRRR